MFHSFFRPGNHIFLQIFKPKRGCGAHYATLMTVQCTIQTKRHLTSYIEIHACWDPINRFNPTFFSACHKPGPDFPTSYVVVFFMICELRREVVVHFVDIGGIVDHRCLNFLFINFKQQAFVMPIIKFTQTILFLSFPSSLK